jgi:Rps23 Pro-64 3,4-dihydroxylase Tpa1-like proline 4-hydroxylase
MKFVNSENLISASYENYPFPHTVIDNFLNEKVIAEVLDNINSLQDNQADYSCMNRNSPFENNKIAFSKNYPEFLKELFVELNGDEFIQLLERITGIKPLIRNDINLRGAGIHRIKNGGYLQLHTDFNSYYKDSVKLDRRINLLIYMNPEWKEEYNGSLLLVDKTTGNVAKRIMPILNRCVIFNTSNRSIHGHPQQLCVPENIQRQSIAIYYYTKNTTGEIDFEGDKEHCTVWYSRFNHSQ